MKNGDQTEVKKNGKPKYSIHDFKEKKRYSREEREKIEAGMLFLELIRKSKKLNEQAEEPDAG